MFYYLISNGGQYSDYGINAVVASETEIDEAEWDRLLKKMESWLNANVTGEHNRWFLTDEETSAMYASAGLRLLPYVEYSCDPRKRRGKWDINS